MKVLSVLSLVLVMCSPTFTDTALAGSGSDIYIEEINADTEFSSEITIQKIYQISGLKGLTVDVPGTVELVRNSALCAKIPQFGINPDHDLISIKGSGENLNKLKISFDDGQFHISSDTHSELQIAVFVDNLESISLDQRDSGEQSVRILLNQNIQTNIGSISAPSVTIDMQGHGSFDLGSLEIDNLHLNLDGHGRINIDQIKADSLDVTMNGHGDITFSGDVLSQVVNLTGHGSYNAATLHSSNATVFVRGHAISSLQVSDELALDVLETDNVHFLGNPNLSNIQKARFISPLMVTAI
ncbi:MAG: hypothetical protein ACI9FB_003052 [Candidatus Azotimanducaceae bacterium]|jgi:hypothetical protein